MKKIYILLLSLSSLIFIGCADTASKPCNTEAFSDFTTISSNLGEHLDNVKQSTYKEFLISKYEKATPTFWGEHNAKILSKVDTDEKIIYLTFDACGSKTGNKLDKPLIDLLTSENINATLFINERWIDSNTAEFIELSKNPLFEIENHGTLHKPLSINGKSIYNIKGTSSSKEIYEEVENNALKIESLIGRKPKFFRSGTAYYDDVAINLVNEMGYTLAGFNVLGDAGATLKKNQIIQKFSSFENGSIFLFHMNHPESDNYEALKVIIPELKNKGYIFGKLEATLK